MSKHCNLQLSSTDHERYYYSTRSLLVCYTLVERFTRNATCFARNANRFTRKTELLTRNDYCTNGLLIFTRFDFCFNLILSDFPPMLRIVLKWHDIVELQIFDTLIYI